MSAYLCPHLAFNLEFLIGLFSLKDCLFKIYDDLVY